MEIDENKEFSEEISRNFSKIDLFSGLYKMTEPNYILNKKKERNKIIEIENCGARFYNKRIESNISITSNKKYFKEFIPYPFIENFENNNITSYQVTKENFEFLLSKPKFYEKKNNNLMGKNYECEIHKNEKYIAYCNNCNKNLCKDCIEIDLIHNEHEIKKFNEMNYCVKKKEFLLSDCQYYLDEIKDIVIDLCYELECNNCDKIKYELIKTYKKFYKRNQYQLHFIKRIINSISDLSIINYQILKNMSDLKIYLSKLPDLSNKTGEIKAKILIELMENNNN